MASADKNITTEYMPVEKTQYVRVPVTVDQGFILRLSHAEAGALMCIFGKIGGHPSGPRGLIDSIDNALLQAGAYKVEYIMNNGKDDTPHPSLYFKDEQ